MRACVHEAGGQRACEQRMYAGTLFFAAAARRNAFFAAANCWPFPGRARIVWRLAHWDRLGAADVVQDAEGGGSYETWRQMWDVYVYVYES